MTLPAKLVEESSLIYPFGRRGFDEYFARQPKLAGFAREIISNKRSTLETYIGTGRVLRRRRKYLDTGIGYDFLRTSGLKNDPHSA